VGQAPAASARPRTSRLWPAGDVTFALRQLLAKPAIASGRCHVVYASIVDAGAVARASALEGAELLRRLVDRSTGGPVVLGGGGITAINAAAVVHQTEARELHFSARRPAGAPSVSTMSGVMPIGTATDNGTSLATTISEIIEAAERAAGRQ
jgi:CutC family